MPSSEEIIESHVEAISDFIENSPIPEGISVYDLLKYLSSITVEEAAAYIALQDIGPENHTIKLLKSIVAEPGIASWLPKEAIEQFEEILNRIAQLKQLDVFNIHFPN